MLSLVSITLIKGLYYYQQFLRMLWKRNAAFTPPFFKVSFNKILKYKEYYKQKILKDSSSFPLTN